MTCMKDSETHKQVWSCWEERREAGRRRDMRVLYEDFEFNSRDSGSRFGVFREAVEVLSGCGVVMDWM